ncbi:MAG: cbb3-type cytochrome oxidase assembly protein CcoS [Ignavibacteriaceae bacterium]|jgi:cbb3-type cytochrome oxidase maturation protein|nr:cbb3-type cytochrome oxidase assembly protein CcoS [Ignavibacteriaceae bacterium]HPO55612.1 cbb3-type cytochrome oxidase assembly protein CcoS [Ignavibacteriaceae bacterium]
MSVIAILIIFSLIVAGGFLIAFLWAVKSGQYDDKYTPSVRILFDDLKEKKKDKKKNEKSLQNNGE